MWSSTDKNKYFVDFSNMSDLKIKEVLKATYGYHQGNLSLESIKSASKETVWEVINKSDIYGA